MVIGSGPSISRREAGKKGGLLLAQLRGPGYYSEIGRKGGNAAKAKLGHAHYERIGQLGGAATRERHGAAHYAAIGRKGGKAPRLKKPANEIAPGGRPAMKPAGAGCDASSPCIVHGAGESHHRSGKCTSERKAEERR